MKLTEEDGRRALRDHVLDRALAGRRKYGAIDAATMMAVLEDRELVRYPVQVVFDASQLRPGEFAHAEPCGQRASDGFTLFVHPDLEHRPEVLPLAIAYHLVVVNYGDIATAEDAELFGATLLGLEVDDYYRALCEIADSLPVG